MVTKHRMFSSTVIPTIGRPTLKRAVMSVINQAAIPEKHEVIVVNDSGKPLMGAPWLQAPNLRLVNTVQRERSVARNTGAAIARGRYLHFLDDDDWMAPGALRAFWDLAQDAHAGWLYGTTQLVDREGRLLIQLEHDLDGNCFTQFLAGEWIPLQASLISTDCFFRVGGFNAKLAGPEDIDLLRRVALNEEVAGTSRVVAFVARGDAGSATDPARSRETALWAREEILDAPLAFQRMRASAPSGFLRGRMVRAYATSFIWNLRRLQLFKSVSRALYVTASLVLSLPHLPSSGFWQAVLRPYRSPTFERGFRKARGTATSEIHS